MPVTIGARADHGFDEPLGLLSDCHRRIERFLGVLLSIADDARGRPLGPSQREAVEVALRYFREAAPRHTADEEHSLFPRLRDLNDDRARHALAKVAALEKDHDAAELAHAEVERWFERWLELGTLATPQVTRLRHVIHDLKSLYERHIAVEDRELFPLAAQVLDAATLADVGREMASRRGLSVGQFGESNRM